MRQEVRVGFMVLLVVSLIGLQVVTTSAQGRRPSRRDQDSESLSLRTKDGVVLKASYYASSTGKYAVPIIMLHDFKESRSVFNGLAKTLQKPPQGEGQSYAVITVDLRGHGESTTAQAPNGQSRELDASKFGKQDFRNMVLYDMEAVRKFLVKKNDASELNLNSLCLLGSGMGANVATSWAAVDWSAPKLASRKQGQDAKALVLVSPEWNHRGLPLLKPLRNPGVRQELSIMIAYGTQDRKASKSVSTILKNVEKYHPDPPPEQGPEARDLVVIGTSTSLQGTKLLTDPDFGMFPNLEFFLDARLVQQEYEWIQRRN